MIYILCVVFLLAVVIHVKSNNDRRGRILQKLPGPVGYPILGSSLAFFTTDPHKFWTLGRRITKQFYPISKIWIFLTPVVNVAHPDDLEILFSSQKVITKGFPYKFLTPWLKNGLLTSTGEKWRHRRKILTPAFHFNILKRYMEIIDKEGQKCVAFFSCKHEETEPSLVSFCSTYTLNVICESAMGVTLDSINIEQLKKYKQAVYDFGNIVIYRCPRPYLTDWMLHFIYSIGAVFKRCIKTLHDFSRMVINDRRQYHESTGWEYATDLNDTPSSKSDYKEKNSKKQKKMAMLDLLLSAEREGLIDDEGIQEEVDTFIFEGHDTTAMAMAFTLFLLAENKEAQTQARLEATELFDQTIINLEISHLQQLNYIERCIKESLRLYPPVSTIVRRTEEDLQLKNGLVPANTDIAVHFWDTHRDPNFWPNPDKFDPDRFLPENSRNRHPFSFVPFSAGPRNCIGQKFAMMELKSIIGRILYDFYLEPIDRISNMKIIADIIMRPKDPVKIKFIKINKTASKTV